MNKINERLQASSLSPDAVAILKSLDVGMLDIPNRAKNALLSHQVTNVFDAMNIILHDFQGMTGIGSKTIDESNTFILDLLRQISQIHPDTIPNLFESRQVCDFNWRGNLLETFPAIIRYFFKTSKKEQALRNQDIFYRRYNLNQLGNSTLEEIGQLHQLTRERVRQIEAKIIESLTLILTGESKSKYWVLDCRLTDEFKRIRQQLAEQGSVILTETLEQQLYQEHKWFLNEGEFRVFMKVLGYSELPQYVEGFRGHLKPSWYDPNQFDRQKHEGVFKGLDFIFDSIEPISLQEAFQKARNNCLFDFDYDYFLTTLHLCKQIEVLDRYLRVEFTALKSVADKAFRLLQESQEPLHYSELCQKMNAKANTLDEGKMVHKNSLVNQLTSDSRFLPLGKSGKWGLTEWPYFENITIVQAMQMVLDASQEPLSFNEIVDRLKAYRSDASEKSILVYLLEKTEIFSKVGVDLYGLSDWGMIPLERRKQDRISNSLFYEKAMSLLKQTNPMPLPEFLKHMMVETGLQEVSIRKRIQDSPILKTRNTSLKYHEIYCDDCNVDLEALGLINFYLKDRIEREIISYFKQHKNRAMRKKELYDIISEKVACHTSTFYQYLDKFESIHQIKIGQESLVCLKVEELEH